MAAMEQFLEGQLLADWVTLLNGRYSASKVKAAQPQSSQEAKLPPNNFTDSDYREPLLVGEIDGSLFRFI